MSQATPRPRPPGRYRPVATRRSRLLRVAGVGLLAAAGLAWVTWAGLGQARAEVRWDDIGFVVQDGSRVTITYDIGKDPRRSAVCDLRALDRRHAAVGVARITIGPSTERVTRRTDLVRTSGPAVAAKVRDCTITR